MSDISGSASLQFWQGVAAVVGASVGGFFLAVGRKAGSAARQAPEAAPAGDALQRDILAATRENTEELRGLRADWQAKREADEQRRMAMQNRALEEQIDDLRRGQRISRANQNDIKVLLDDIRRRSLPSNPGLLRLEARAAEAAGDAESEVP